MIKSSTWQGEIKFQLFVCTNSELTGNLYRVVLTSTLPPEVPQAIKDRLHEFDQQVGLLVPKPLPDLPRIPLELLPTVVTHMELHYLDKQELTVEQFKAAKTW